ncbi:MAG: DNA polymerase V [Lasallia pustulata]|uniref:DNA polymerase V n=1 Tax=Lasallia pustulata TaxID=136370 RepID=A0A5M8PUB4_9LECA|nr:MAG: DNA polymerase V [Lasallia pustulata]
MTKKRKREQPSDNTRLVGIYEDLANENEEVRLEAAHNLLSRFSPESSPTGEEVFKILKRLIRGLCSGRKAARLGFSVALTELLIQLLGPTKRNVPNLDLSISKLIGLLKEQTRIEGSVSGQEERDHHFGRLFGLEALIKSGILFKSGKSTDWDIVLDLIFELAKKKPWLREECGWIIYGAIQNLHEQGLDPSYVQAIIDRINSHGLAKTSEGIAIWIAVQSYFPAVDLPAGIWKHEDPLSIKEKSNLAKVLKEASFADKDKGNAEGNIPQKGSWNFKIHFAWPVVLAALLKDQGKSGQVHTNPPKRLDLKDFWNEAVDNSLFAASSSEVRKYWGLLLFEQMFGGIPEHLISILFSKNLMRCLMNHLTLPDRYLHRVALKVLKAIHARVVTEPQAITAAISGLLGPNGHVNFDHVTKTKTVEKLLSQIDAQTLRTVLPLFERLILMPQAGDETGAASRRQILADQLLSLIRSRQIDNISKAPLSEYNACIEQLLAFFVDVAYFSPRLAAEPPVSKASQDVFRSRISSSLTHLVAKVEDPAQFPYYVAMIIHKREKENVDSQPLFDADENVRKTVARAWKTLDKLHLKAGKPQSSRQNLLRAFKLLYSLTILQTYNGDSDAVTILDELRSCYDSLVKHRENDKQGGPEILVEILLSLVSKPSLLFRRLAQQVFGAFAPRVNATGLQSMVAVLETKENISGQEEMFEQEDAGQDDEAMSDVEEIDMAENNSNDTSIHNKDSSNGATDLSNEKEDEENEGSDGDADELAAFDAKLAQALGTRRADEDVAAEDDESSDVDMDDAQMEALDEHLEKVFRERKKVTSKKKERRNAKETVVNFKCRVLELLDVYIKQQHAQALCLDLIMPLLQLIRTTGNKQVSEKATALIREYFRLCKGQSLPVDAGRETLLELLTLVHSEAGKEGSNAHAYACSQASLLLAKVLAAQNKDNLRAVIALYAGTQEMLLFDSKCKVKPSFFSDWLNWCVTSRLQLQS